MNETSALSSTAYTIWWVTLAIVVIVIVPLAIYLLDRTLRAARSIRGYVRDMLTAGVGVAGNTAAIPALGETTATAVSMIKAAESLKGHSSQIVSILGGRAQRSPAR